VTLFPLLSALLALTVAASPPSGGDLRIVEVGRFDFTTEAVDDSALAPEELSGITAIGEDAYLAVSDEHPALQRLTIRVDRKTGAILSVDLGAPIRLRDKGGELLDPERAGGDREGIAFDPSTGSVWIANERTDDDRSRPSLERYEIASGRRTGRLTTSSDPALAVFAHSRNNRALEGIARIPETGGFWTANEEALVPDGDVSNVKGGTVVRLVRLDAALRPVAQAAYRTEPLSGPIRHPLLFVGSERNGVSDLLALPGGTLLVLEREFAGEASGSARNRIRLFAADVSGATDVSRGELAGGLDGRKIEPAAKRLLFDRTFAPGNSNFEGMTLGPALDGGDRSLLLVADNNGGAQQALLALRISGLE